MSEYLEIGKIVNTHGIKGEIKVIPLTDSLDRFNDLDWVYVDKQGKLEKYNIEGVRPYKGLVMIKFKEITDMSKAEELKGLYIKVDRENAVKLPEDSFFICDLIGCEVYDDNLGKLGIIKNVLETGSNDVFVVDGEKYGEVLIPALKSVVKEVSVEEGQVRVSLPEGLIDNEV
ncbi:MAG TPA: ribosome maturation factor RimM [Clostridiaceae bacterium]|nr:ribosome maturation factor RimM [Clostridiaceae bacterium]